MTVSTKVDLTKIQILSVGTGPLQLGAAVPAFRGVEALTDAATYTYSIQQGSNYEIGQGTFSAGAGTLSRGPIVSSAGGAAINLSPNAICTFTVLASDLAIPGPPGNPGAPGDPGPPGTPGQPGTILRYGAVDPVAGDGLDGDFYINTATLKLFGPKAAGAWPAGVSLVAIYYGIAGNAVSAILAGEIITDHVVVRACTIPADFAGSVCSVGTSPAATFILSVYKNATLIGTITISTAGAVTFATVGHAAVTLAVGDVVAVFGPATADTAIARLRYTLRGN